MTPEQEVMFKLQNTFTPGQSMSQTTMAQPEPEMDEVNQGLALTMVHMAQNGPVRPIQRGRAKTMTKDQYKEQMMNEERGLPSNLNEASRVVALEQKIKNVDSKLDQILGALTGQPVAPPPTPQERPVVEQPESVDCKARTVPPGQLRYHPPLPTDDPPTETPIPEVPVSLPATSQQPSLPLASPETVLLPSMVSLGPVGSQGPDPTSDTVSLGEDIGHHIFKVDPPREGEDEMGPFFRSVCQGSNQVECVKCGSCFPMKALSDGTLDVDDPKCPNCPIEDAQSSPSENIGIDALIEEDGTPAVDPVEEKRLERQQILTDQVATWLKAKNPHGFWKRFLASACNKNLSYNTWPPEFQASFDERFKQMIQDTQFISTLCGRILRMQNGHMVSPNVAGAFVVVVAGMLSFALLGE
jgi:hypothetical protein